MATRSFLVDENLDAYLRANFDEPPVLAKLREETAKMPNAGMQIGGDQGVFMGLLAKLMGAKSYLEIGVFTGYSSTAVALAMPEDGKVVACDVSEEFTSVARRYWAEAGVAGKIDLRLGPALESLESLLAEDRSFDLCFIDADKPNYPGYWEKALNLVRPGGAILIDNVLWSGKVVDLAEHDETTELIRLFNTAVFNDPRVDSVMLTIGDGLTLARVK